MQHFISCVQIRIPTYKADDARIFNIIHKMKLESSITNLNDLKYKSVFLFQKNFTSCHSLKNKSSEILLLWFVSWFTEEQLLRAGLKQTGVKRPIIDRG